MSFDERLFVHNIDDDHGSFRIEAAVHEDPNDTRVEIVWPDLDGMPVLLVSAMDAWADSDEAREWAGARRQRAIADGEMQAAAGDEVFHDEVTA